MRNRVCSRVDEKDYPLQRGSDPRGIRGIMSELRIFSYLSNPRIWKATIAARLCGVEIEVRGGSPKELESWLWDFDARPLSEDERRASNDVRVGKIGFQGTRLHKTRDRKSTRLNSSHGYISYAVFC